MSDDGSNDIEYQIGGSDVDQRPSTEDAEFIPFEMEARAVFNRLAEDIYPSPRSGIREALTNAVTATLEAIDGYDLEPEDAVVSFRVEQFGGRYRLTIQDNGIGMSEEKIRKVVSHIGRSTVRDDYDKGGQFGMGFLALFTLCGTDGGFTMESRPRKDRKDPVKGIWKDGGFSKQEDAELSISSYGTKFEIFLKKEIEPEDIRSWISDVAEWSRVPVMYEEETENRSDSEEYGIKNIDSIVDDSSPRVDFENDYIELISSPDIEEDKTVLLDVPIESDIEEIPGTKWNTVMRLKTEHQLVVCGDNKGKMVVTDAAYRQMEENRKRKYTTYENLSSNDIVSPEPTGTREKLSSTSDFWMYVANKIREEINEDIERIAQKDATELTEREISKLLDVIPHDSPYKNFYHFCNGRFDLADSRIDKMYAWTRTVELEDGSNRAGYDIQDEFEYVFMTTGHVNEDKREAIHNSDKDAVIVDVNRATWYDFYSELLGWEELREFDENHELYSKGETNNAKNSRQEDTSNSPTESGDETVRIRFDRTSEKVNLSSIEEKIASYGEKILLELENVKIQRLLVFKSGNSGIKENAWIQLLDGVGLVNSNSKEEDEKLLSLPCSTAFNDYVEEARDVEVLTANGEKSVSEVEFQDTIVHVVSKDSLIPNAEKCEQMETLFDEGVFYDVSIPDFENYIVVSEGDFREIAPLTKSSTVITTGTKLSPQTISVGPSKGQCALYLECFENRENEIVKSIDRNIISSSKASDSEKLSLLRLLRAVKNSEIDIEEVVNND